MDNDVSESLNIVKKKHDLIALRIHDEREQSIPNLGLIEFTDAESGENIMLDTGDRVKCREFKENYKEFVSTVKKNLQRSGVDHVDIETGKDYVLPLINFFKNRSRK